MTTPPPASARPRLRVRRRRAGAVGLVVAVLALGATACIPQMYPNIRFASCTIPWYDTTVSDRSPSAMEPYFAELHAISGIRFARASYADAEAGGLLIERLASSDPRLGGQTGIAVGTRGADHLVHWATISLRADASAGMRRHELGHLFGLDHNPSSELMRPVPSPTARYATSERIALRDVAQRSGCP